MPHGTPDWGLVGPMGVSYELVDLGEHAARLGSIVSWERQGNVILMDDFESGLHKGSFTGGGAGWSTRLFSGAARSGAFSVRMIGGSLTPWRSRVEYFYGLPPTFRVGLEFAFTPETDTDNWSWGIEWRSRTDSHIARVRYDHVNGRIEYDDAAGLPVILATIGKQLVQLWPVHVGKLVVDMSVPEYVRFILDGTGYPMPGIGIESTGVGGDPRLWLGIDHISTAGKNAVGYMDCMIVTQNEP